MGIIAPTTICIMSGGSSTLPPGTSYQQWRELQDKLKERNKSKTSKRKKCKRINDEVLKLSKPLKAAEKEKRLEN